MGGIYRRRLGRNGRFVGAVATGLLAAFLLVFPHTAGRLRADTVVMKDGGLIQHVKVLEQDDETVTLRTPGGKMGVPKAAISRIDKAKSVFDTYEDKRKAVKPGDADGLFNLAEWCRKTGGLREEMFDLLEKVVKAKKDHADARRLLGYVRKGERWELPAPLSIRIVCGDKDLKKEIFEQLSILLETRKDFQIVDEVYKGTNGCDLAAAVELGGHSGTTFYGQKVLEAKTHAKVSLKPGAPWIAKDFAGLDVFGVVDTAVGEAKRMVVVDAMTRNAFLVHEFLDRLTLERVKAIEGSKKGDVTADGKKSKSAKR
jgi:hypothetical protein